MIFASGNARSAEARISSAEGLNARTLYANEDNRLGCAIDSFSSAWQAASSRVQDYPAGSWGPAAAASFLPVTLSTNGHRKQAGKRSGNQAK